MLTYRNRAMILQQNPHLAEALDDVLSQVEGVMQQTNSAPVDSKVMAPPKIQALTVTAAQGIFDASISDNHSSVSRGIQYGLEYDTTPAFSNPTLIHLGPSRKWRGTLGNQTLYWRAHNQYVTGPRSEPTYHNGGGAQPISVYGGGVLSGPSIQPSNGSGTTEGGTGSDGGYGNNPYRGPSRPVVYTK